MNDREELAGKEISEYARTITVMVNFFPLVKAFKIHAICEAYVLANFSTAMSLLYCTPIVVTALHRASVYMRRAADLYVRDQGGIQTSGAVYGVCMFSL